MSFTELYASVLRAWPYGEASFFVAVTMLAYLLFYWGGVLLLEVFCYRGGYFAKYKIQQTKTPDSELVAHAYKHLIASYVVVHPIAMWLLYEYGVKGRMRFAPEALPPLWEGALVVLFYHIAMDFWFYFSHRLMHMPFLYGRIHKQHHTFYTPIGVAAAYAHPLEDIIVNAPSTWLGVLLYPSHIVVFFVYLATRYNETVDAHSGYAFPFSLWSLWDDRTRRHDYHHSNNVGNFGAFPFWDWLCGTDRAYNDFRAKQVAAAAALNVSVKDTATKAE